MKKLKKKILTNILRHNFFFNLNSKTKAILNFLEKCLTFTICEFKHNNTTTKNKTTTYNNIKKIKI